jgi:hypothetical protein
MGESSVNISDIALDRWGANETFDLEQEFPPILSPEADKSYFVKN